MILQHVWCELRRRKARTLVTVLGYGLAVSSMMVLVGVLRISGQGSAAILDHTGTHFVAFSPVTNTGPCAACAPFMTSFTSQTQGEGLVAFGTRAGLMPHSVVDKIRSLSTVADAAPYLQYRFRNSGDGHLFTVGGFDPANTMVVGTTCCAATDVIQGRFLVRSDRDKILLEQAYAKMRGLDVGNDVRIAGRTFNVLGIINPGIRPAKSDIYMPYEEAKQLVAAQLPNVPLSDQANLILVEVKDSSVQDQAIREVKSLYPDMVISSYACYKPAARARAISAATIAMLVVAIGIFTILLAMSSQLSVLVERRRELGILKTIGFSNGRIMGQILLESSVQAALGASLAGLFVLLLMPWVLLRWLAHMDVPVSDIRWLPICLLGISLSFAGGFLAGLFPALWACRQRPARLLRSF
jgi:putative ABC transport system permease protein